MEFHKKLCISMEKVINNKEAMAKMLEIDDEEE